MSPDVKALTARVDFSLLYPPFAETVLGAIESLSKRGLHYYAISGLRSIEEQRKLYALGRVEEGGRWIVANSEKVVTNARPGFSTHNYGIALDVCLDADVERAGLQPVWRLPEYEPWADECKLLGLDAAYFWTSFREGPHAQLNLRQFGITTSTLHRLYEQGGQAEVWKYLSSFSWKD